MAKCKDCIHNEVCDQSSRMMWATMEGKTECDDFKDRSRYVVREKGEWIDWAKHHAHGLAVVEHQGVLVVHRDIRSVGFVCSLCNKLAYNKFDFCPNCGADVRKGENDG